VVNQIKQGVIEGSGNTGNEEKKSLYFLIKKKKKNTLNKWDKYEPIYAN
jgi:hypothetical protein